MNAIAFYRVSTGIQDLDRQKQDVEKHCANYGYHIIKSFEETISGLTKVKNRPKLIEMLNFAKDKKNNIGCLVISELSRLGRNSEILSTIDTLTNLEINLCSLKEQMNTFNADGSVNTTAGLMVGLLSAVNQYEVDTMKYRIISGMKASALKGNVHGGPWLPYGYIRSKNVKDKKYHIDKAESEMVKYVYDLYLQGNGTMKIKGILNRKGYPTRKGVLWSESTVHRILTNNIYCGKKEYKGEFINLPELRIIDEDDFNLVQDRLRSNYSKIGNNTKFDYKIERGKIICGVCRKTFYPHKRSNGKDNSYKCISRRYSENCGNYGIGIDKLTKSIESIIGEFFIHILIEQIDDSEIVSKIGVVENNIVELNFDIEETKAEEKKIIKLYLKGTFTEKLIDQEKLVIMKKLDNYNQRLRRKKKELKELLLLKDKIRDVQFNAETYSSDGLQKEMFNKLVTRIVIFPAPEIHLTNAKNDRTVKIELQIIDYRIAFYLSPYFKGFKLIWQRESSTSFGSYTIYDESDDNDLEEMVTAPNISIKDGDVILKDGKFISKDKDAISKDD